jgi:hypothetical protein
VPSPDVRARTREPNPLRHRDGAAPSSLTRAATAQIRPAHTFARWSVQQLGSMTCSPSPICEILSSSDPAPVVRDDTRGSSTHVPQPSSGFAGTHLSRRAADARTRHLCRSTATILRLRLQRTASSRNVAALRPTKGLEECDNYPDRRDRFQKPTPISSSTQILPGGQKWKNQI